MFSGISLLVYWDHKIIDTVLSSSTARFSSHAVEYLLSLVLHACN
jgi:hypothetical protein